MKKLYNSRLSSFSLFLFVFFIAQLNVASLLAMQMEDCSPGTITGDANLCVGPNIYQFQNTGATGLGYWSSLNEAVATVSVSGEVTAVGAGTTKIRYTIVSACDPSGAESVNFDVSVISAGTIAGANSLEKGKFAYPNAIDATPGGTWASSDESVAVFSYGPLTLTALKAGRTTISYTVSAGGCTSTSVVEMLVSDPNDVFIDLPDNICVKSGDAPIIVNAPGSPGGYWELGPSASGIATIDLYSGALKITGTGSILVSHSIFSPYRATFQKTVNVNFLKPINGAETIIVSKAENWQQTFQYTTGNAAGGTWNSSHPEVATVDAAGLLTPVSVGTTVISYSTEAPCMPNVALKTVSILSPGIISGPSEICGYGTGPYQYQVTGSTPGGLWASSRQYAATVDQNGLVTPLTYGETTISYTAPGSEIAAEIVVFVFDIAEIDGPRNVCLTRGKVTYNVNGASYDGKWTSSNTKVATVDPYGELTLRIPGTTVLTYTAESPTCGQVSVTQKITVGILDENVEFYDDYQILVPGINPLMDVCTQVGTISSPAITNSNNTYIRVNVDEYNYGLVEYIIRPDGGSNFAADLVLYYFQEDFDQFNKYSDIKLPIGPDDRTAIYNVRIYHSSEGDYPDEILRPKSVIWNATKLRWEVAFSVTHFSYFYLDAVDSQLPVTLVSFKALKQENDVALNWVTEMETNSEAFEIQHSTNGKQWQKMGTVQAVGESQTDKKYSYLDKNPSKGDNFYRLKMIDQASSGTEQTFTFSKIQYVNFEQAFAANIFPNPATERFTIETSDWEMVRSIKIYNLNGVAVHKSTGTNLSKTIDIRSVPAGTYVMEFTLKNRQTQISKIVIAR